MDDDTFVSASTDWDIRAIFISALFEHMAERGRGCGCISCAGDYDRQGSCSLAMHSGTCRHCQHGSASRGTLLSR